MNADGLFCKRVIEIFEDINKIPRGSGNEKGISDYLVGFARERGLEVIQDEALNVLIRKGASPGFESRRGVIIQGHMDMVCEKNADVKHDFLKDPINLVFEGDFIKAEGTTLGADDGIAVAMGLAVLESEDIAHPPLEVLITTDEEVGMGGARAFDTGLLNGSLLLNIDSEAEGVFTAGCAGGARAEVVIPVRLNEPSYKKGFRLVVDGLKGGHSGIDIDKERANANQILARALKHIKAKTHIEAGGLWGGSKDNAIPRNGFACVFCDDEVELEKAVYSLNNELSAEYSMTDPGIALSLEKGAAADKVFDDESLERVLSAILLIPCGIVNMSGSIKGLVETSNNIGSVRTEGSAVKIVCALRSAVETRKEYLKAIIASAALLAGGKAAFKGEYPAWEYKEGSYIRSLATEVYERLFGKKAVVDIIHAGLECGLLGGKKPELDMISLGPDILDIHSPDERLSISSTERTFKLVCEILKEIN